jgi:hypothetical protein
MPIKYTITDGLETFIIFQGTTSSSGDPTSDEAWFTIPPQYLSPWIKITVEVPGTKGEMLGFTEDGCFCKYGPCKEVNWFSYSGGCTGEGEGEGEGEEWYISAYVGGKSDVTTEAKVLINGRTVASGPFSASYCTFYDCGALEINDRGKTYPSGTTIEVSVSPGSICGGAISIADREYIKVFTLWGPIVTRVNYSKYTCVIP